MRIFITGRSCPSELAAAVEQSSSYSDVFDSVRSLCYHHECFVTVARAKGDGRELVMKSFFKDRLNPTIREQVENEVRIHSSLNHKNVLPLLLAFEDSNSFHMAVQYADGGDLRSHMRSGLSESGVRDLIVAPLLQALALLEDKQIVHRDLKPENVLVRKGCIQLADFGLSMNLAQEETQEKDKGSAKKSSCTVGAAGGTPMYASPEVLLSIFKNQNPADVISTKNDIWALGVMTMEALTGRHPFAAHSHHGHNDTSCWDANGDSLMYNIAFHKKILFPSNVSTSCVDFLEKVLHRDPALRTPASELLHHPWLAADKVAMTKEPQGLVLGTTCWEGSASSLSCARAATLPPAFSVEVECWEY